MLNRAPLPERNKISATNSTALETAELSVFRLYDRIQRRRGLFAASILFTLSLAALYILLVPAQYTAKSKLLIDSNSSRGVNVERAVDLASDGPFVDTQVELLRSENVALAVISKLKIQDKPDFLAPIGLSAVAKEILKPFKSDEPLSPDEELREIVKTFLQRLKVTRVGRTYTFDIEFTAADKERASEVANALVELYVVDQLQAKFDATQRASLWLQERLTELGRQANEADRAVVEFKNKNKIMQSKNGQLMNEQQLSEINSQLVTARAATAEAKARLDRIDAIIKSPEPEMADSAVTDALKNEVIIKLRNQYLDLAKREADWSVRLGATHLSVINLRNDMREIRKSIRDELQRIGEGYRSDYEIAKSRQQSMEESLGLAVNQSQTTNTAQVELRELESSSQSYRTLYDNFLQKQLQAMQLASFPLTEARAITVATPPLKKSNVSPFLILAFATAAGIGLGAALATIREISDQTLRTADDVEDTFGLPCIGSVPKLSAETLSPEEAKVRNPFIRHTIKDPMSRLAECVRELKVPIESDMSGRRRRVIGFVSSLPGEGKTTLASNFAELLAHSGSKVVLIDGDMRKPSLTRAVVGPEPRKGLIDVLDGKATFDEILVTRPDTGLKFAPVYRDKGRAHTSELLASGVMRSLIDKLKQEYDYVIVDLPPLMPVIDSRAAASHFDGLIFVAEWGQTRKSIIRAALNSADSVRDRLIGIVLSKVDMSRATRYEYYSYYGKYAGYYTS